jgi:DNA repair exonuclease SbcCD ATPase subunit
MTLEPLRKQIDGLLSLRQQAEQTAKRERERGEEMKARMETVQQAREVVNRMADRIKQETHQRLAGLVSRCLQIVFDEPYSLAIEFGSKSQVVLRFERNGKEVDPMTASGGGVIDVASFALRLACIAWSKPKPRQIVVMDEPFKFLSERYRDSVRVMLETLVEEYGFQFIMVTHIREIESGKVVSL